MRRRTCRCCKAANSKTTSAKRYCLFGQLTRGGLGKPTYFWHHHQKSRPKACYWLPFTTLIVNCRPVFDLIPKTHSFAKLPPLGHCPFPHYRSRRSRCDLRRLAARVVPPGSRRPSVLGATGNLPEPRVSATEPPFRFADQGTSGPPEPARPSSSQIAPTNI